MKTWIALLALAALAACNNLLIADVEPEKQDCSDTTYVMDDISIRKIDTMECKTGRMTVKWAWED